jgi:hypothetical protein
MKVSISVPDSLWAEAQRVSGRLGGSELVQAALRDYVERGKPRPLTLRDVDPLLPDLVQHVRQDTELQNELRLARQEVLQVERKRFADGYRLALRQAGSWQADVIRSLVRDWPNLREAPPPDIILQAISDDERIAIGDAQAVATWTAQNSTFLLGYRQGLQDVWESVSQAGEQAQQQPGDEE